MNSTLSPTTVSINSRKSDYPAGLDDVALIDGKTCAAAGGMSLSQWHSLVASGDAPKPAIRQPRYSRWLLPDVRTWLVQRVAKARADTDTSANVIKKAKDASEKAQEAAKHKAHLRTASTAAVSQTVHQ
jgi:predicted DNA-binding transcriptional regulator AlpA